MVNDDEFWCCQNGSALLAQVHRSQKACSKLRAIPGTANGLRLWTCTYSLALVERLPSDSHNGISNNNRDYREKEIVVVLAVVVVIITDH